MTERDAQADADLLRRLDDEIPDDICVQFTAGGSRIAPDFYCSRCGNTATQHTLREAHERIAQMAQERDELIQSLLDSGQLLKEAVNRKDEAEAQLRIVQMGQEEPTLSQARAERFVAFKRAYFSTLPADISQLAADAMIVVIDLEAQLREAEAARAPLLALIEQWRKENQWGDRRRAAELEAALRR